ncbi:MAG: Flp pilus assembly protein CpaB [Mariprofundus sp.]
MRKRGIIVLLIALLMGAMAVVLVNMKLKDPSGGATAGAPETAYVIVAAVDLETGNRLSTVNVRRVSWPRESMPEGAFSAIDTLLGKEPPVVIGDVHKGEPILPYKLAGHGARAVLAIRIPDHMKAIAILVNEVRGVAGFVLPGDRVDILVTAALDKEKRKFVTRSLVQNVTVLGVDQVSSEKEEKPKVVNAVTLLVNKKQGELLTLAQSVGELTLLLRNESDASLSTETGVVLADLKLMATKPVKGAKSSTSGKTRSGRYLDVQVYRGIHPTNYSVKKSAAAPVVAVGKGGAR